MQFFKHFKKSPSATLLLTALAAAGAVAAAPGHAEGVSAAQEISWLSQLAANGDTGAQLQLGLAYRDGRDGLAPDPKASVHWLTAAAQGGDAYAADAAANVLAKSGGTAGNMHQAVYWWEVGAQEGNADAQTHVGELLMAAGGNDQGLTWLRDAADRGDAHARNDLARLYRKEALPDADLHRGENQLAALGERLDSTGLKAIMAAWHTVERSSPAFQSADALISRAKDGDPVAEYQLGMRYRDGAWGVDRDPQQALFWLRRSAAAGNRIAAKTLSEMGNTGETGLSSAPRPAAAPGNGRS